MVSKKEALMLGLIAIGGLGAASMLAGNGDDGGKGGGILGTYPGYSPQGEAGFGAPAETFAGFPPPPTYDFSKFFAPQEDVGRGEAGVSAAPKKTRATKYLYTGGEVKTGAVSVAPWAMGRTTPSEIGVTTALKYAQQPKKVATTTKKKPTSRKATPGRMGYSKAARSAGFA